LKIKELIVFFVSFLAIYPQEKPSNIFFSIENRYNLQFQNLPENNFELYSGTFSPSFYEPSLEFQAKYSATQTQNLFGDFYQKSINKEFSSFQKVLGMISTSAAVGLAGYHIYKYSDEYELSSKKRK